MTNHLVRLYALAAAILAFFVLWATIASHPWAAAPKAAPDQRLVALAAREKQLRHRSAEIQKILKRRWAVYGRRLEARRHEIAAAEQQHQAALAAARYAAARAAAAQAAAAQAAQAAAARSGTATQVNYVSTAPSSAATARSTARPTPQSARSGGGGSAPAPAAPPAPGTTTSPAPAPAPPPPPPPVAVPPAPPPPVTTTKSS